MSKHRRCRADTAEESEVDDEAEWEKKIFFNRRNLTIGKRNPESKKAKQFEYPLIEVTVARN